LEKLGMEKISDGGLEFPNIKEIKVIIKIVSKKA